ncbi:START-like domain-containing protein [Anditalea andensis]|uniref:ATPase n=1 Tax=Anditalea andensis TaxID=1048983 RepID=A0A074L2D4_9BACT|nr:START-like domain-containing protein [Anditalea andensis]KEO74033.1 ATPase [Anditalea andensis]
MVKNKFVSDYQINTSRKIIFPYLSTASGLSQWFADDVSINEDRNYVFSYDGEDHIARIASIRSNQSIKFEYFDPNDPENKDNSYIEFKLDENELTQTLFLKITDYSDAYDDEEQESIWESLIMHLKEIIGG